MSNWGNNNQGNLSAVQQYLRLKRDFPDGHGSVSMGKLIWRQSLRPTPISRCYDLRVILGPSPTPKVFVENPCLRDLTSGRSLPHVYQQNPARLCLYQPNYREWAASMFLSETILPWASLWLFYFEDWLITDQWNGGGEHPDTKSD